MKYRDVIGRLEDDGWRLDRTVGSHLQSFMGYVVVVEKAKDGSFSAYVPDLPGCVTCGDTIEEVQNLIEEALAAHLESLRSHGEPVPEPSATTFRVNAA